MNKLIITLVILFPVILLGQEKKIPLNISVFNEATAIPFTRFFTIPIHPGLQLGTEFNYYNKEYSRLYQSVNVCYFYHNYLAQGIGINSELSYEYRLRLGIAFTGLLGLGYMHTFATSPEYILINGRYEKRVDKGNARLYPSVSIDIGYYLKPAEKNSLKIFMRYQSWAEYPYSPDFIPVMTHINLHIGVKFFINVKAKIHKNE